MDDLLVSSEENLVTDIEYLPHIGASDHICLTTTFGQHTTARKPSRIVYHFDKADFQSMADQLSISWNSQLADFDTPELQKL